MKVIFDRIIGAIEFTIISLLGYIFGVSFIVKYLRNPNPNIVVHILRSRGASIGHNTSIKRSLFLDNVFEDKDAAGDFSNLQIGGNCYIGDCVYFDLSNKIIIEDNVVLSGHTAILTHADCGRSDFLSTVFPRQSKPVIIHNDVWLCFRVTVLCGIEIGPQATILAHSLVNSTVEPKSVYGGTPAKKLRNMDEKN